MIIAIVVPVVVILVALIVICVCCAKYKKIKTYDPVAKSGKRNYFNASEIKINRKNGMQYLIIFAKWSVISLNVVPGEDFTTIESLQYDLATLKSATSNFSDENKLGEGGFGSVYKVRQK